jgi:hypothetical protein
MNLQTKRKRPLGLGGYLASIGVIFVVAVLAGIGSAIFGDGPGLIGQIVTAAFISAAMAVGFVACLWWWRGIDEAAREAHKWAWWWGGSGGMAVGGVVFITLAWRDDAQLPAGLGAEPVDIFAAGIMAVLLFQIAGYALAWAAWWLKHR